MLKRERERLRPVAEKEWEANAGSCQSKFSAKEHFIAWRVNDLYRNPPAAVSTGPASTPASAAPAGTAATLGELLAAFPARDGAFARECFAAGLTMQRARQLNRERIEQAADSVR